ncbi:hypothetical protein Lesp02_84600 [Lentzea sp. NBRC 105346]|uniref:maleylpyruvate isomerase family mycothiol-dependent enzyme n=1 Tax=Lentzea sp. NBRC 105346 TaxID=3032205 RepID=UPI0024A0BF90|nr:maleylpyruvate isomerase family mycothiol-dependent enzyme [Lentzea sp. NBRC 105346]GLZ36273.1 hypothetical protein Lesp02_84600 [Lentzea sp. NBRC 105346]
MDFVERIKTEAEALRAAALLAGPEAVVPTCPDWTVHDLVTHIARVHSWVIKCLALPPQVAPPRPDTPPEEWNELLNWWDERVLTMTSQLRELSPDTPVWTFGAEKTASFWPRRQAHETAIHHLDALHATGHSVPTLLFDSEFAADGVDEFLTRMVPRQLERGRRIEVTGRLLLHAADAGRTWEVRLAEGEVPVVGPVHDSATDEDATVAGTADALYRAVWNRPSHAVVSGNRALLDGLPRP